MKFFKWLKNLFTNEIIAPTPMREDELEELINQTYNEATEEIVQDDSEDKVSSVVSMIIMESGNIDIQMQWGEPSEASARNFATMLFQLNSGFYEESCFNVLVNMGQQNPAVMPYIRDVITDWNKHKAMVPIIKPSEVFQLNHNNGVNGHQ